MKKLSRIVVLCLTLIFAIGMTFVLTACDEENNDTTSVTTPTYKVTFVLNKLDGTAAFTTTVSVTDGKKVANLSSDKISLDGEEFAGYTYNNVKDESFNWYTNAECTESYDFDSPVKSSFTLYANLSANGKETNADLSESAPLAEQSATIRYMENGEAKSKFVSLGVWTYKYSSTQNEVPNDEYVFDFNKKFSNVCAGAKASFKVYSDENCTYVAGDDASKSQIVTLTNGNNYYYLKIFAEDERLSKVYKVNIYLQQKYTVSVQTIEGNSSSKSTTKVLAGSKLVTPDITGLNPGYSAEAWYYYTKEKRNEEGQIVDENGDVLIIEDGVYYVSDGNGNKLMAYQDANGNAVIRVGDKYYKADKSGSAVLENGAKIELSSDELYNILDKNGLPTYEVGYPITGKGNYINVWSFDKTMVTEDYMNIFCRWKQETYTVTLTFKDQDSSAKFGGKNADVRDISFDVKYGTSAAALAGFVKNATAGVDPVKDYASFDGWYYNDARMVGANSQGVSSYNITDNATFYAKFIDNAYTVNVSANDSTMVKSLTGDGTSYKYGEEITLGAVANDGYELVGWTKNGKEWTDYGEGGTIDSPKYQLNISDIKDGAVTFTAIFEPKTYKITFVDDTATVKEISVVFDSEATLGDGENDIPNVDRVSSDKQNLFVGWYYLDGETEVYIVTYKNGKNVISDEFTTWTFTEDKTIYAMWKAYNFTFTAYQAMPTNTTMGNITGWDNWTDVDDISYSPYKFVGKQVIKKNEETVSLGISTQPDYYTFVGWYLIDESAENPYDFANMQALVDDDNNILETISININEADVVYVALWEYNPVTITFEDTSTAIESKNVAFNTLNYVLPIGTTTDDDKEFVGWFDGNAQYTDENGKAIRSITNKDYITSGLKLQAKFQAINYFNVENGVIIGLSDKGAEKVKKGKTSLVINIDDEITAIGDYAFDGNTTILEITINGNIQVIGANAFANSAITKVTFNGDFKGLTVETGAFANCLGLTSIAFPANTVLLEDGVLDGCANIASITYTGNMTLGSLFTTENPFNDNSWYSAVQGGVTYYVPSALKSVTISTNLYDSIVDYAFQNCVLLESVTLGANTISIGSYAFALTETTLSDVADFTINGLASVQTIGNYAFYGSNIKSVTFTALTKLGVASFKNTTELTSVDFTNAPIDTIANSAFEGSGIASVNLKGIKYINANAFMNALSLSTLTNATSVLSLGEKAFYGCMSLSASSVSSMTNITDIAAYALDETGYFTRSSASTTPYKVGKILYYSTGTVATDIEKIAPYAMTKASGTLDLSSATNLKYIESNAFSGNESLTSITFPSSLVMVKANAFTGATALITVNFSACKALVSIGKSAFEGCTKLNSLSFYPIASADELSTKLSIKANAFKGCTALTAITLPDNLAQIGEYAFDGCTSLQTVNLIKNSKFESASEGVDPEYNPSSDISGLISTIEKGAFRNCALTAVSFPFFITSIQESAFEGCAQLASFTTMEGTTQSAKLTSIGNSAFKNCVILGTVDANATGSVSSIGAYAFENCAMLNNVNFKSVSKYLDGAFRNCSSLATMTMASSISSVGAEAFKNCKALSTFYATVKDVSDSAFENCESITAINFASGTTAIGANAFNGCILVETISIPKSVVAIGDGAFAGCRNATTISFDENGSLQTIGVASFANCSLVESIILPKGLLMIGDNAFSGCSKLTSVEIGEDIEYIGMDAFAYTDGLEVKLYGTDAPYLAGDIFTDATDYTIYVREGYVNAYKSANVWKDYADESYKIYTYIEE